VACLARKRNWAALTGGGNKRLIFSGRCAEPRGLKTKSFWVVAEIEEKKTGLGPEQDEFK
jgi:hypothetical protein